MENREDNPLVLASRVSEFEELNEFMNDPELAEALHYVVELILKPDVPPHTAQPLITKLQAYSTKFAMMATIYTTIKKDKAGSANHFKKNIYYTASDSLDKLVQALKYSFKLPH